MPQPAGQRGAATPDAVEHVFREHHGRAVAALVRAFGDLDAAQDAVQEAFAVAVSRWPAEGVPPSPDGWIITTARRAAIDRFRRESARGGKEAAAALVSSPEDDAPAGAVPDDRLRLLFTCCHPALAPQARVALTLRMLGGLTTAQIAAAFLVPESTVAQRVVRAKAKIRHAGIPYRVPEQADLPERLDAVLTVIYLVYNQGYLTDATPALADEALRLARAVADLMPDEPEALGLLALLLFLHGRRDARLDAAGRLVRLPDQDRSRWDDAETREARGVLQRALAHGRPGPYQLQAAINAVHADAPDAPSTDWPQILAIYDHLLAMTGSPVVAVNRAVAVGEVHGPAAALDAMDDVAASDGGPEITGYYLFHAVRADLLRRAGRGDQAREAYTRAAELASNPVERTFLLERAADAGP